MISFGTNRQRLADSDGTYSLYDCYFYALDLLTKKVMKKMYLSIPQPCHEDWDKMTPNQQGRFCNNCQKTVIDFTNKSDGEILNYFKNHQGKVCGQFREEQLNKTYVSTPISLMPQWLKAGLLASGLLTAGAANTQAINQEKTVIESRAILKKITIKGSVLDETGEPLIGVVVKIVDTEIETSTDFDGYYELVVPKELTEAETWKIDFKYTGFSTKKMHLENSQQSDYQLDVVLNEEITTISEVITLRPNPKLQNDTISSCSDPYRSIENKPIVLRGGVSISKNRINQIFFLKGRVINEYRQPLINVSVKIGSYETTTNAAGKYELKLVKSDNENPINNIIFSTQDLKKKVSFDNDDCLSVTVVKSKGIPEVSIEIADISLKQPRREMTLANFINRWFLGLKKD